ncbi:MAG: phosphomannomutase/phosphoglucomutase [Gammaproteobacteria bacterium]
MPAALSKVKSAVARMPGGALRYGALAVAVVVLLVIGQRLHQHWRARTLAETERAADTQAATLATKAAAALTPYAKGLVGIAQDPRVIAALSSPSPDARDALGTELQSRFPGALRLRLLPRGTAQTDPNSSPPLTYASLDLVLKAEQSPRAPGAELHLAGTPNAHVALVQRAPPQGEALGVLHLALPVDALRNALVAVLATAPAAQAEVRQQVPGAAPLVIAQTGPAVNGDAEVLTKPIPGTGWVLALRTSVPRTAEEGIPGGAWLGLAVGVLGVGFLAWRRRGGTGAPDEASTVFQGAIQAILSGEHPGLAHLLPGAAVTASATPPASRETVAPVPAAPVDEASTTIVARAPVTAAPPTAPAETAPIAASIFRSYDIRGIVGETLTPEAVYQIGRAFGAEAADREQRTVVVARDGRASSAALRDALVQGLRDAGRDVLDIGLTPTPVLYFATHYLDTRTGVMVTGSHNPPEYNGLKMVLSGETLSGDAIQAIRARIESQSFSSGTGSLQEIEIIPDYIRRISEDIPVSLGDALKVVVDCGNAVPGIVAPHILRAIGHDVIELHCEVDSSFPNHHPDPSQPENLADLIAVVRHEEADLGLAFDGDGDRLGVVDRHGNILWPDRQLMLFARDVLGRNPGAKIIYDVKCSRLLANVITEAGGEPVLSKSGHSLIKQKMQETGALLAGELSGHIFFKERWYGFDDALYSAARLLEILVNANRPPEEVFASLPQGVSTPELRLDMPETRHAEFMEALRAAIDFPDGEITDLDGIRVDFAHGWGLVRPSNTTPCLVLRFEGDDESALHDIEERFRAVLMRVDPDLTLPF